MLQPEKRKMGVLVACLHNSFLHLINIYCSPTLSKLRASDVQLGMIPAPEESQAVQEGKEGHESFRQRLLLLRLFYFVLAFGWVGSVESSR